MRGWMALALMAGILLSGCTTHGREPDNLALVRVLGVDGAGPVTLTGVCGGANQKDESRGSCQEQTFALARERLPWSGQEELALTSVSYLVMGEDADLAGVLLSVLEDPELGASATVWVAREGAGQALAGCEDPATDLELLLRQGVQAPDAAQALAQLYTQGQVILPVVGQAEGRLEIQGEWVWKTKK